MAREIKFRAWDKRLTIMRTIFLLNSKGIPLDVSPQRVNKELELMQYTGLKDKNGKDIYEGDILKDTYAAGYSIYVVKFGPFDNGEDYEDNESGNGWFTEETAHYHEYTTEKRIHAVRDNMNDYNIVGNIYENPALLEASK